jgi:hypothetical protein
MRTRRSCRLCARKTTISRSVATTCVLDRKEFGLGWNAALEAGGLLLGDEMSVSITLQTRVEPAV